MAQVKEKSLPFWSDPAPLGFMTLGIGIFSTTPHLTGRVPPLAAIATVPWGITALIVYIIVTIILFRKGDILSGTAFGVLGIVLGGAISLKSAQDLMILLGDRTLPGSLIAGGLVIEGMIWIAFAIILVPIGYLVGYKSRFFAGAVWLANVGVGMMAAVNLGLIGEGAGVVAGYFIFVLGIWFLYLGIAGLVNGTLGRTVIPLGKPLFGKTNPSKA